MAEQETFKFRADLEQFHIHCLQSNNSEIFLRELFKNSFDAVEKFQSLTDENSEVSERLSMEEYFVHIVINQTNNTLSITDNGIGMTKADLVNKLGRYRYGISFFSAFLVAYKVVVTTKHDDDEQCVWESEGVDYYTIAKDASGEPLGRGTKVTLFLTEDQLEYLEVCRLQRLITKNFNFISCRIYLWVENTTTEEIRTIYKFINIGCLPRWVEITLDDSSDDEDEEWVEKASETEISHKQGRGKRKNKKKKKKTAKQVSHKCLVNKKRQFEGLCKLIREVIGHSKVERVLLSTDSIEGRAYSMLGPTTMVINIEHPKMEKLRKRADAKKDDPYVVDMIRYMYEFSYTALYFSSMSLAESQAFDELDCSTSCSF